MVNFYTKTSLELLLENSTKSVILTIDEEKKRPLLLERYIVIDFNETPPRKFVTTG